MLVDLQQDYIASPRVFACDGTADRVRALDRPRADLQQGVTFFNKESRFSRWIDSITFLADASASHARNDVAASACIALSRT